MPMDAQRRDVSRSNGNGADAPFVPIEPLRAHEHVAEQLRRHIGLGVVRPGDALPSERELAQMFGVGRATVQAALRMLDADGLVQSRRGRGGGTFVRERPRDEATEQRLLLELRLGRTKIEDALLFRRIVEEGSVVRAAGVAEPDDLDALRDVASRMAEAQNELDFHRHDTEFHLLIARASHSALLLESVERCRLELNAAIVAMPESDAWHRRIVREHAQIVDAIAAGDARKALRAMGRHLAHTESGVHALLSALG